METPKASPHITAGVETLLTLPCPKPETEAVVSEEKGNGKIPALVASVWFFVVIQMREKVLKGIETSDRQAKVRDVLNKAREEPFMVDRVGDVESAWKGWEEVNARDVLAWNREIGSRGWKEMDWFLNVPEGTGVEGEVPEKEAVEELNEDENEDEDEMVDEREGRKPDTMHQKKYDYLSARNRAEYKAWKEDILALAREMQKADEDTEMIDA
jgi:origin recognition complex subunit 6